VSGGGHRWYKGGTGKKKLVTKHKVNNNNNEQQFNTRYVLRGVFTESAITFVKKQKTNKPHAAKIPLCRSHPILNHEKPNFHPCLCVFNAL
jgi:hypothetical protein